jgi:hypothetical protein
MTLDDFRRLIARISLAAPPRPALATVKVPRPASKLPAPLRPRRGRPA